MSLSRQLPLAVVVACALGLAACGSGQPGQPVSSVNSLSASAPAAATPGKRYQASISLEGQPKVTADGKNIVVTVQVTNTGEGTFGSETQPNPVNLGAHSIDASGKVVNNDVSRGHLPQVAPRAAVTTSIRLPAAQMIGNRAAILPVQENVAWFDQWGTQPLVVGPFKACSDAGKICDASGKPLPVTSDGQ